METYGWSGFSDGTSVKEPVWQCRSALKDVV